MDGRNKCGHDVEETRCNAVERFTCLAGKTLFAGPDALDQPPLNGRNRLMVSSGLSAVSGH